MVAPVVARETLAVVAPVVAAAHRWVGVWGFVNFFTEANAWRRELRDSGMIFQSWGLDACPAHSRLAQGLSSLLFLNRIRAPT